MSFPHITGHKSQSKKPNISTVHNKRITYIIYGYSRKIEQLLFMALSDDIKLIICKLYEESDSWNMEFIKQDILIAGRCVKVPIYPKINGTAFGNKIIKPNEYYHCQLTVKGNFDAIYVGIIKNNPEILKYHQNGQWSWHSRGNGYVLNCKYKGFRFPNDVYPGIEYGEHWGKDGDVLQMIVDLTRNNANIGFIINGTDYGIVYDEISKKHSYRLAVCIFDYFDEAQIELL